MPTFMNLHASSSVVAPGSSSGRFVHGHQRIGAAGIYGRVYFPSRGSTGGFLIDTCSVYPSCLQR